MIKVTATKYLRKVTIYQHAFATVDILPEFYLTFSSLLTACCSALG